MLRTDAEFTWVSGGYPYLGVARAGVDLSAVRIALHRTPDGWMYSCGGGAHMRDSRITPWASGEQQGLWQGGTVGLLLKQGSLAVYIQGRRIGVLCTDIAGCVVWAADLNGSNSSVRIRRRPPPDEDGAQ